MNILKKIAIFFIVMGIVFGYGLVPENQFYYVHGETPAPTPVTYVLTLTVNGHTVNVVPPGITVSTGAPTAFTYPAGTVVTLNANSISHPDGSGIYFVE